MSSLQTIAITPTHSHATQENDSYRAIAWNLSLLLMRWLMALPVMLFSSDPSRFLPTRKKHKHHHPQSQSTQTLPRGTNSSAGLSAAISPVQTPQETHNSYTTHPVANEPPPPPFLSPFSFPIPSSCLPAARYFYNLDEAPWPIRMCRKLLSMSTNVTVVGTGTGGTARASTGAEALSLLARKNSHSHHHHEKKKRWTLVLDLDETLVHTTSQPLADYDCRVEIHTRRAQRVFYISKRPYLDTFLATLATAYDIVIFTASIRRYADAVIDLIDVHRVVGRRFFRQSCVKQGISFLKDLRPLVPNGDLRRTILIDNSPVAYTLQQENALPISTWINDPNDTALRDLIPFLLALRSMDDVRPLLYRRHLLGRLVEPLSSSTGLRNISEPVPQIPFTSSLIEEDELEGGEDEDDEQHKEDDRANVLMDQTTVGIKQRTMGQ